MMGWHGQKWERLLCWLEKRAEDIELISMQGEWGGGDLNSRSSGQDLSLPCAQLGDRPIFSPMREHLQEMFLKSKWRSRKLDEMESQCKNFYPIVLSVFLVKKRKSHFGDSVFLTPLHPLLVALTSFSLPLCTVLPPSFFPSSLFSLFIS